MDAMGRRQLPGSDGFDVWRPAGAGVWVTIIMGPARDAVRTGPGSGRGPTKLTKPF